MTVNVNAQHRLRDIDFEVNADSFKHAASLGHDVVAPVLSVWAYLHDAPITTSGFQIVELATGTQQFWVRMLGAVKAFADAAGASHLDHRVLLSAYREGISSTEPLWQALSLFRVIEGVFRMRAERLSVLIAGGQKPPSQQPELFPADVTTIGQPNDFGLHDSLKPYAGRKFMKIHDDIRSTLRNAISHLDPDGDILVQDRWEDLQLVERTLPALRWMARQLLDTELQQT